jgi:hypothetical protein
MYIYKLLAKQVLAEKKRGRKKERLAAAKLRQRVAMNMEAGSFEVCTCIYICVLHAYNMYSHICTHIYTAYY